MSLKWSTKALKATPVDADTLLIIDSADPTTNKRITVGSLPSTALPVEDITPIVKGSTDDTKLLRFEVDGFTTATTRVLTPPNDSGTIVLEAFTQTLTNKTITAAANTLTIASTDLTDAANIVLNNQTNTYSAGARQDFLGDTAGTSGLNIGAIAGNPITQADGDLWLNTSSNILFARINGADVNLSAAGEVFTWSANHDANGFALEAPLFADPTDSTKLLSVDLAGNTTAITLTLDINQTTDQILSVPNITASDSIVTENFTQTLLNKTLTTPTIASFINATHDHQAAASGGQLDSTLALSDTVDIAYLNTANTFIAGNLNQFGHDATNAGLRVVPFAGNPTVQNNGEIWYNLTTNQLFGRINGADVNLGSASQTPWIQDIDAATFDLRDLSNLEFQTTTGPPAGTVQAIYADVGGIIINVPTSDSVLLKINDNAEYSFDANDLNMNQNGLFNVENIVFAETLSAPSVTSHAIYVNVGGIILNNPTGDVFDFQINGGSEYTFNATVADWNGNNLQEMGILSFTDVNTSLQQSTLDLQLDVATGGTVVLRVDDVAEYEFDSSQVDFNTNSIINATIDGDLNNILDIKETQMRVSSGADGTVLTSGGDGTIPTYVALGTGGDVVGPAGATNNAIVRFDTTSGKAIKDGIIIIDDVANVELIRSLQFATSGSPPGATISYIAVVGGSFEINVTSGNVFKLEVDENVEYEYSESAADFKSNNLIMGSANIQLTSIASPGDSGAASVGKVFLDSGNFNHLTVRRNDGIDVDLEAGSQTPWVSNIDADGFNLQDLSNLEFRETTGVPTASTPAIYHEATGITINVPTGDSISLDVQSTTEYIFDATQVDFNGNAIFAATIDAADQTSVLNIDETMQTVLTGGAGTVLTSGGTGISPSYESIFPINFPEIDQGIALANQDISFASTDRHSQKFTLTQNTIIDNFVGQTSSTTEYIDLIIVQDTTGGWTLTLPAGTVNKAEVEAGVNLGASEETLILIKFAFGTNYAFLQGTQTTGLSQTPWLSDIDADSFNLSSLGTLSFNDVNTAIEQDASNLTFKAAAGGTIIHRINDVAEYIFSNVDADFVGNNILNAPQILDANGFALLIFTTTSNAVNELTLVNAATTTPVEIQATGTDANIDVQFTPKGTGTFYGNRETWGWPLTDETTAPTIGVKFTTEPAPYDMAIEDAIAGLTTAGTGGVQATGTVTCVSAIDADTVTVNGLLYTGVNGAKIDDTQFSVDTGDNETATDLADSITNDTRTGTDEATVDQTAIAATNVVTITASVFGTIGNNVTLSSSDGATLAVSGANLAGGLDLFTLDVLKEDSPNADTFTTIFTTNPTINNSDFTSTTATTAPVISVATWEKGRRLQLSIDTLDTNGLARGAKIVLVTHATDK